MATGSRRKVNNTIALTLSVGASAIGLACLAVILITLIVQGLPAISPALFTEMTPPPGETGGGLLNAIFGSVVMVVIATIVATPIGILAGTYLTEFSRGNRFSEIAKFINDVLLSAPSIVIGLFVYTFVVVPMGDYSAWAGIVALAIIALPVVNRTTQDMMGLVPNALREASAALGTPRWKTMTHVIYRSVLSGIMTGVLLAVARISGETAPLLFTAYNNQFWSTNLSGPISNLPVTINDYTQSADSNWIRLAWGGALLMTAAILLLNIIARYFSSRGHSR
jgi:phosphate transport system permease protein